MLKLVPKSHSPLECLLQSFSCSASLHGFQQLRQSSPRGRVVSVLGTVLNPVGHHILETLHVVIRLLPVVLDGVHPQAQPQGGLSPRAADFGDEIEVSYLLLIPFFINPLDVFEISKGRTLI